MLFESLFKHAAANPGSVAIIDDRGQTTYQQLAAMSAGLSVYLSSQTQRKTVGLLLPASAGFAASFYATLLAGKTVVPLNFLLGDREIAHCIADSGVDTIITIPQLAARLKDSPLKIIDITQLPPPPNAIAAPVFPNPKSDDVAVVMYTSGTSGLPKGVVLTYGNLQSNVNAAIEHVALQHQHRFLGIIPLFHSFGMTAMMLAPIQLGATIIYLARFSAVATINAIRQHQVSLVFGVPSMFAALLHLKNASAEDFKSIYACISGAEPLPATLREAFKQRFGVSILEGYGLTETSPVLTLDVPQSNRPGTTGKAVPGAEFKIVDDDGNALSQGKDGEIWARGPMIMKGYHNLPEETARVLTADGFFKTGDIGHFDVDGYLLITGRKKELIIIAGEKASPREIEDVLLRHPAIQDAAVLGRKDESRGEAVVAFITPKPEMSAPSAQEIRDFCREHALANWKIPKEIHVLDELPRSPTGKVLKRILVEKLTAGK